MNLKFQIIAFLNILKERPLKIQTWTAKAGTYSKNSSFNIDQLTTSKQRIKHKFLIKKRVVKKCTLFCHNRQDGNFFCVRREREKKETIKWVSPKGYMELFGFYPNSR